MKISVSSTSGSMMFEFGDQRGKYLTVDMTPDEIIAFVKENGQCVLDWFEATPTHTCCSRVERVADPYLTLEVYDDYRE